ncbi:tRNA (adenosine(37)-N6)-threonylcarbamoyltransferase complex dimerization subunit type 1 TsaB [Crocinitomicaceae bacterium]|nr:tRNA (adenosine(37)-N6)-threonylcarbamoyltransferase complex dimerization subunit type 1 TsaB [Crocinitomicaceae bacterium]
MRFLSELILHIETATKICSVALSDSGTLLDSLDKEPSEYIHGEYLTLFIEELLQNGNKTFQDLDAISVSIGPGSYTGLRIGLAVAKGLCFGLKIPLITVETLDSLLALGRKVHPDQNLCAVLDARRMEVYSKIISSEETVVSDTEATIIDESTFTDFEPFVCFGDGAAKLSEIWSGRDITINNDIKLSAAGQLNVSIAKFRSNNFEDLAYIKPMYIKEFKVG